MSVEQEARKPKLYEQGRIFTGHRVQGPRKMQTQDNLERRRRGCRLDGQDKRCQRVMRHLWGSFDAGSLYKVIHDQFPYDDDEDQMWHIAQRIADLHCDGGSYSDGTIAELLEPLVR